MLLYDRIDISEGLMLIKQIYQKNAISGIISTIFMRYKFDTKNLPVNENENKIKKLNNSLVAVLVHFLRGSSVKV